MRAQHARHAAGCRCVRGTITLSPCLVAVSRRTLLASLRRPRCAPHFTTPHRHIDGLKQPRPVRTGDGCCLVPHLGRTRLEGQGVRAPRKPLAPLQFMHAGAHGAHRHPRRTCETARPGPGAPYSTRVLKGANCARNHRTDGWMHARGEPARAIRRQRRPVLLPNTAAPRRLAVCGTQVQWTLNVLGTPPTGRWTATTRHTSQSHARSS